MTGPDSPPIIAATFQAWGRTWTITRPASCPLAPHERGRLADAARRAVEHGEPLPDLPPGWDVAPVEHAGTPPG